jgi:hypothetical protein
METTFHALLTIHRLIGITLQKMQMVLRSEYNKSVRKITVTMATAEGEGNKPSICIHSE